MTSISWTASAMSSSTLNGGNDWVRVFVSYTLSNNVEIGSLTGTSALNLTGNGGNNILNGNAGVNTISGGAGNDMLDGRGGSELPSAARATTFTSSAVETR